MKKLVSIALMLIAVFSVSARDTVSRDLNVIPMSAQTVLRNNFKSDVNHIKIDKDFGRVSEYEVILNDGSEIVFDRDGNWKDVEVRNSQSVPSAFIPKSVASYVKQNQKNVRIVGIEKEKNGYTVDLSNGVEMKFDKNGNFSRYKD